MGDPNDFYSPRVSAAPGPEYKRYRAVFRGLSTHPAVSFGDIPVELRQNQLVNNHWKAVDPRTGAPWNIAGTKFETVKLGVEKLFVRRVKDWTPMEINGQGKLVEVQNESARP